MIFYKNKSEIEKFGHLLSSIHSGNIYFITGKNGSGKSRFFSYATESISLNREAYPNRLICFSGTMHDKYPAAVYKSDKPDNNVIYLGNKVNNNMVSDIAPFRKLCHYILNQFSVDAINLSIRKVLDRLNFQEHILLKFRYGKNRKSEVFGSIPPQLDFSLIGIQNDQELVNSYLKHLIAGDLILSDIGFFRENKPYRLSELSSGEKQYALALLGLIYCGNSGCVTFYDEPENSLHPAWQLNIVKDMSDIMENLYPKSTLIIATHSPLIASGIRSRNVFICDLPAGQSWKRVEIFGRTSDAVLREQFHLYSARSPEIIALLNKCLDYVTKNEINSDEFRQEQEKLRSYNLDLTSDDPLYNVVNTILKF
ncbi:MAG: AAA family ATPase [Acetobacter orientalis]|uniref:AAA family ATPase n=1 Tax=Acetobacter orientalis TaxID=146474 RepID=UPI0039EC84EB